MFNLKQSKILEKLGIERKDLKMYNLFGKGTIDDILHPRASYRIVKPMEIKQDLDVYCSPVSDVESGIAEDQKVLSLKVAGSRPRFLDFGKKEFYVEIRSNGGPLAELEQSVENINSQIRKLKQYLVLGYLN